MNRVARVAMLSMALLLFAACGSQKASPARTPVALQGRVAGAAAGSALATGSPGSSAAIEASPAPRATTKRASTPQPTAKPTEEAAAAATTGHNSGGRATQPPDLKASSITFAVVGDAGNHSEAEKAVAQMVEGWKPDFVIDTGDGYYTAAGGYTTDKYDRSVGAYYCDFLKDVTTVGTACPHGDAEANRFFPTIGNHDYSDAGIENYLKYFDLPGSGFTNTSGNERYYDFTWGPVHFFSLNSNPEEPDGRTPDSKQGQWLKRQLSRSTSPWNIVYFHHPPYSSGENHGSNRTMQWPFKDWGVAAVFSGHEHLYERLLVDGVVYFVNGAGGGPRYTFKPAPVPGSEARIAGDFGAQKVTVTAKQITFEFYTVDGRLADLYTINR